MKEKQLGFLIPQLLHTDSVVLVVRLPCQPLSNLEKDVLPRSAGPPPSRHTDLL